MVPEVSNLTDPPDASAGRGPGPHAGGDAEAPGPTTVAQVISIIFSRTA